MNVPSQSARLRLTLHRTVLVYSGVFTFLVDAYPVYAASALAANSFARSMFAGIFPLFGIQSKCGPALCMLAYRLLTRPPSVQSTRIPVGHDLAGSSDAADAAVPVSLGLSVRQLLS